MFIAGYEVIGSKLPCSLQLQHSCVASLQLCFKVSRCLAPIHQGKGLRDPSMSRDGEVRLRMYHRRIGFDLVMLYFDAPDDPHELDSQDI